uniref:Variant surface glycoprotein 1125.355 n=1 Tax=Trypanosoma brucei TaxID=5691 RepID=A0A1J0R5P6_9TRYP|nr:variant surface glycoprotein 1125.355 [Trypanosoma brucei]
MNTHAVIALLALAVAETQATTNAAACTTNCGCWARLEKQITLYRGDYSAADENLKENKKNFGKIIAAAILGSTETRTKLAPVLLSAAESIDGCEEALTKARPAMTAAETKVAQLRTLYTVQHRLQQGNSGLQIHVQDDNFINTAKEIAAADLGKLGSKGCEGDLNRLDAATIDKTNIDNEKATAKVITHVHVEARCQRDSTATNSCHDGQLGRDGKLEFSIKYDDKDTNDLATWVADTATKKQISATEVDFIGNLNTETNTAIKELKNTNPAPACTKKIRDYATIAENSKFNLMVTKALIGKTDAEAGQESKEPELAAVITKYYGTEGTKFEDQLWKAIERTPAYLGNKKKEQTTKIENLETLTAVGEATARGLVKQIAAEAQDREPASGGDQSAEKQCSGKKGNECTGDCKMVDGVCKPAKKEEEEENKEKDAKAASTCTGKDEKTCKSPDCKWDGKECKDSSILVNKQFALSVVSAAFVALLF